MTRYLQGFVLGFVYGLVFGGAIMAWVLARPKRGGD